MATIARRVRIGLEPEDAVGARPGDHGARARRRRAPRPRVRARGPSSSASTSGAGSSATSERAGPGGQAGADGGAARDGVGGRDEGGGHGLAIAERRRGGAGYDGAGADEGDRRQLAQPRAGVPAGRRRVDRSRPRRVPRPPPRSGSRPRGSSSSNASPEASASSPPAAVEGQRAGELVALHGEDRPRVVGVERRVGEVPDLDSRPG